MPSFDVNGLIGAVGGGNGIGDDIANVVGAFKGNQFNNQPVYVPPPQSEPPYLLIVGALVVVVVLVMVLKK